MSGEWAGSEEAGTKDGQASSRTSYTKGSGERNNQVKIQARDPRTVQDKKIPKEHRAANPRITIHETGPGGGAAVSNWGAVPRNCHNGIAGSE